MSLPFVFRSEVDASLTLVHLRAVLPAVTGRADLPMGCWLMHEMTSQRSDRTDLS